MSSNDSREATFLSASLNTLKDLVIVLGALGGGFWAVVTLVAHESDLAKNQNFEARRPFLDQQLKTYVRATELAGYLTTQFPNKTEWEEKNTNLDQYIWVKAP